MPPCWASRREELAMKYVVCVPDGCADEPVGDLGGRTPLEAAQMPVLDALAARGEVGRAAVIPDGMPPGSDVGNMAILGYDPATFHTGRAPIEAAALGLRLDPDQVAYRCNLVTVGADGTMVDFAGGHPTSAQAHPVIEALQAELGGDGVAFHPGVEYRHIMVAPGEWADATCVPPHDLSDKPAVGPAGPAAPHLQRLMDASRDIVSGFGLTANQIWLWGQGFQPQMQDFSQRYGVRGALCSAVDLVRGLGVLTGMDVVDVDGMSAGYDTDYAAQRDAALAALADGTDLFLIHVEATDEAGHAGNVAEKVTALERWDELILRDLVDGLDRLGPWRLLLLPDHATPLHLKTHTPDPVPYVLVDSEHDGPGGVYSEPGVADAPVVPGHELLGRLLARD
ncbi:MAG: 2,3-bisphosphoglycerate-independent phosphoglycerate mutase [Acidimicrobiales bacterium]|nr:2,3-bisphosphoglycerate-independent phosphoglycerate mutase [Acidimicrobiales bacterium]